MEEEMRPVVHDDMTGSESGVSSSCSNSSNQDNESEVSSSQCPQLLPTPLAAFADVSPDVTFADVSADVTFTDTSFSAGAIVPQHQSTGISADNSSENLHQSTEISADNSSENLHQSTGISADNSSENLHQSTGISADNSSENLHQSTEISADNSSENLHQSTGISADNSSENLHQSTGISADNSSENFENSQVSSESISAESPRTPSLPVPRVLDRTLLSDIAERGTYMLLCQVSKVIKFSQKLLVLEVRDGTLCNFLSFSNAKSIRINVSEPPEHVKTIKVYDFIKIIVKLDIFFTTNVNPESPCFSCNGCNEDVTVVGEDYPGVDEIKRRIMDFGVEEEGKQEIENIDEYKRMILQNRNINNN